MGSGLGLCGGNMASLEEHIKDCEDKLGNGWKIVHDWLDEYAKYFWPWMGHRIYRHNKESIEEVRHKWGEEAAKAAEIHILKDEGDILTKEQIEKRYVKNVDKKDNDKN